jgi:hypothetical protein
MFLQNVGIQLQDYTAQQIRRSQSSKMLKDVLEKGLAMKADEQMD